MVEKYRKKSTKIRKYEKQKQEIKNFEEESTLYNTKKI